MVRRDVMRRRVMVNRRHASTEDALHSANVLLINKWIACDARVCVFFLNPPETRVNSVDQNKSGLFFFFISENTCRKHKCEHLIDAIVAGIHSERPTLHSTLFLKLIYCLTHDIHNK